MKTVETIVRKGTAIDGILNPNLIISDRNVRIGQGSLAQELFRFAQFGFPFSECKAANNGIVKFNGTKGINVDSLYGNKNDAGLIAKTRTWVEASRSMFGKYMETEVAQMWQAFFDEKLIESQPLNKSMLEAQLSRGTVQGNGYKLIQVSNEVRLSKLPDGSQFNMVDIIIAPDGTMDPGILPVPQIAVVRTTDKTARTNQEYLGIQTKEWTQISPLEPYSEKINTEEANLHRELHQAMAAGMIKVHNSMVYQGGEVVVAGQTFERIKKASYEYFVPEATEIFNADTGRRYTQEELDFGKHLGVENKYQQPRNTNFVETVIRTSNSTDWVATGVKTDLRLLIASGVCRSTDAVWVGGKMITMAELVSQQQVKLKKEVATGTRKIAEASNKLATYLVEKRMGLKSASVVRGMSETLMHTFLETWPTAFLLYSEKYYLGPTSSFLSGKNDNASLVISR